MGFGELECLGIWVISKGKVLGGRERMKVQEVNTDADRHRGDPNRAGIGLGLIPKRLQDTPQVGAGSSHCALQFSWTIRALDYREDAGC